MTPPQHLDAGRAGAAARPPRNGLVIAALTLGLIGTAAFITSVAALTLDLIPAVLFWATLGGLPAGLLAVIFGILGSRRATREEATNGTKAKVGTVIGTVALVASGIVFAFALYGDDQGIDDCVHAADTASEKQRCYEGDLIDFIDRNLVN